MKYIIFSAIVVIIVTACDRLFMKDLQLGDIYGTYHFNDTLDSLRIHLTEDGYYYKMIRHNRDVTEIVKKGTVSLIDDTLSSEEPLLNGKISYEEDVITNLDSNLIMYRICKCKL